MTDAEDLLLGHTYQVHLEDCCIRGGFAAVLMEKRYGVEGDLDTLVFGNGVHLDCWSQVVFEEVRIGQGDD